MTICRHTQVAAHSPVFRTGSVALAAASELSGGRCGERTDCASLPSACADHDPYWPVLPHYRGEGVGCSRDREVIDAGNRANQYSTRAIHRRVYSPVYNCMYLRLNSVECTVTTYRLGGLGFECRQGQNMLFFLQNRPD